MAFTPYSNKLSDPTSGIPGTPTARTPVRRRKPAPAQFGGKSSGLPNWFQDPNKRDVRRPGAGPTSPQPPNVQGAPIQQPVNSPEEAQMPEVPLLPEVEDIGLAAALGRQPGIGEPGSLDGMTNRPRRRRLV